MPVYQPSGLRIHLVTLDTPGPPVPDGDGGFTETVVPLSPPSMYASIAPITDRNTEQAAGGTVLALATHRVLMAYHPDVTIQTRLRFNGRSFSIVSLSNLEERNINLDLLCVEMV